MPRPMFPLQSLSCALVLTDVSYHGSVDAWTGMGFMQAFPGLASSLDRTCVVQIVPDGS